MQIRPRVVTTYLVVSGSPLSHAIQKTGAAWLSRFYQTERAGLVQERQLFVVVAVGYIVTVTARIQGLLILWSPIIRTHPQGEIGFAGVAAVGTAWLLTELHTKPIKVMHGRDGDITAWQVEDITWVRASLLTMPPWHHKQLDSIEVLETIILKDTTNMEHTMVWAWIDEAKGVIRAVLLQAIGITLRRKAMAQGR